MMKTNKRIWKIRTVKDYPDAHNHIMIGEVLDETPTYLRVMGRTFHFGKSVNNLKDIQEGMLMVRVIPWVRIQVVHELPDSFDFANATLAMKKNGNVVLKDDLIACPIAAGFEKTY